MSHNTFFVKLNFLTIFPSNPNESQNLHAESATMSITALRSKLAQVGDAESFEEYITCNSYAKYDGLY